MVQSGTCHTYWPSLYQQRASICTCTAVFLVENLNPVHSTRAIPRNKFPGKSWEILTPLPSRNSFTVASTAHSWGHFSPQGISITVLFHTHNLIQGTVPKEITDSDTSDFCSKRYDINEHTVAGYECSPCITQQDTQIHFDRLFSVHLCVMDD